MTGKQLKMWSWETVRRNWMEPAETENLPNSQKCLITLHIVGWVIIKTVSHETVHRNWIKLVATEKSVQQSEMFNNRLGNNKNCKNVNC